MERIIYQNKYHQPLCCYVWLPNPLVLETSLLPVLDLTSLRGETEDAERLGDLVGERYTLAHLKLDMDATNFLPVFGHSPGTTDESGEEGASSLKMRSSECPSAHR